MEYLADVSRLLFAALVLAVALILLKAAGAAVGWGIQFQQPLFLALLTLIVVLFAANLFGLFEIPLPEDLHAADGHAPALREVQRRRVPLCEDARHTEPP